MKTNDDNIVKIAKALSDKTRVKILREIARKGSVTCGGLEKVAVLTQPTCSHHLKILTEAGLLNAEKNGRYVIVTINKDTLEEFSSLLSDNMKV